MTLWTKVTNQVYAATVAVVAGIASSAHAIPVRPIGTATPAVPEVTVHAAVVSETGAEVTNDTLPQRVIGTMMIRDWRPTGRRCLYLPFEDPHFGENRGTGKRFDVMSAKAGRLAFEGGRLHLQAASPVRLKIGELTAIVELDTPPGWSSGDAITLEFDAMVPRLPQSDPMHLVLDGFHPELLDNCPAENSDPSYHRRPLAVHFQGDIKTPSQWSVGGLGATLRQTGGRVPLNFYARSIALALVNSATRTTFTAGSTRVELVYKTPQFLDLAATVRQVVPQLERLFGPYPFPSLTIVETSELQRHGLPGLVAMNRPHQSIFEKVQKSYLNWQHWILTLQLAKQWYGGAIIAPGADDDWLTDGIAEFATLEALRNSAERFNLFSAPSGGLRWLSFDFLQVSELTAATLNRFSPFATLTTAEFASATPVTRQNPLLFIRHAIAMRQLSTYSGPPFFGFLRHLSATHRHSFLSPRQFYDGVSAMPSPFPPPLRHDLTTFLRRWWQDEGWPDFELKDFSSDPLPNGQWVSNIKVDQQGSIDFPPEVGVVDASGRRYSQRAERRRSGDEWSAAIVTANQPTTAIVDPSHEVFDSDRFNNRSGPPQLTFFPGSADTLRDDAYTVIWVPYPFRRPGEPISLGLQAALFRYIQSGTLLKMEYAPSTHRAAYDFSQRWQAPSGTLNGALAFSQTYDYDRLQEISVKRSPLLAFDPTISIEIKARHKDRQSDQASSHGSFVAGIGISPSVPRRTCTYGLSAQEERAPGFLAHGFSYDRMTANAAGECYLSRRVSLGVRGFRGVLRSRGDVPELAYFKPNDLREARLRLDRGDLEWVGNIDSVNTDLMLPFYIPLPHDSLVLQRQMRWRLFYDWGRAPYQGHTYRSGGFGFLLPMGGDLTGAGSLALTRLTVLAILYTKVDQETSKRPAIVFDIAGDL